MANPSSQTVTTTGTYYYPCDYRTAPFNLVTQVYLAGGATATYEVDYTLDDVNNNLGIAPVWNTSLQFPAGSSTSIEAAWNTPVACIRLVVSALSGGTIVFKNLQGMSIN